jgi:hypothetical protein
VRPDVARLKMHYRRLLLTARHHARRGFDGLNSACGLLFVNGVIEHEGGGSAGNEKLYRVHASYYIRPRRPPCSLTERRQQPL